MQRGEWVQPHACHPPSRAFFLAPLRPVRSRSFPAVGVLLRCASSCVALRLAASRCFAPLLLPRPFLALNFPHPPARPRLAFSLLPFSLPPPSSNPSIGRAAKKPRRTRTRRTSTHQALSSPPAPFPLPSLSPLDFGVMSVMKALRQGYTERTNGHVRAVSHLARLVKAQGTCQRQHAKRAPSRRMGHSRKWRFCFY